MPSADKNDYDEQLLTRYLLGELSQEEAGRLDERSVVDDDFAWHLDAAENDLVDAYVRGELSGETLDLFKRFYLSSPKRSEKVEFASTLLHFGEEAVSAVAEAATTPAIPSRKLSHRTSKGRSFRRWFSVPLALQWGFASVAFLMLFAIGFLFVDNARLRKEGIETRERQVALAQRERELERQLNEQRSANAGVLEELERLRESAPGAKSLKTIAVVLLPPTRGASQIATVVIPPGTDRVTLRLQLESDDFPIYRVSLSDPVANQIRWRSAKVKAKPEGEAKAVSITLPVGLLKQQNYILKLTGIPAQGSWELLSSYAFKVVLR